MARYTAKGPYICAVFIISLASITAGLTLEELSLEMRQMKQDNKELGSKIRRLQRNDVEKDVRLQELELKIEHLETQLMEQDEQRQKSDDVQSEREQESENFSENLLGRQVNQRKAKDVRLQELELKVGHLENQLMEQQKEYQTLYNEVHYSAVKENTHLHGKHVSQGKTFFRTCRELYRSDRSLSSGMYWIDPDGYGFDDPIQVDCDMETGSTLISHDSENVTNVGDCAAPGCYSRYIKYSAPIRQMVALAELSHECHQSIKYECNSAPFEINGVAQSWWNDRNGVAQYFWSGNNNSIHTCQCGIDKNCVSPRHSCNCDSNFSDLLNDIGAITDKEYLPVTRLNFGRTQLETSSGIYILGRFECSGQASVNKVPSSCSDLWKAGHILSGIYSVIGSVYVETVYCDFTRLPYEQGFQTLIGYTDVKSSPVYFYVQKNTTHKMTGTIPFEITRLNIGGAMNATSGIFTAPQSGIYSFHFSGLGHYPPSSSRSGLNIFLVLNGNPIGRAVTHTHDDGSFFQISVHPNTSMHQNPERF